MYWLLRNVESVRDTIEVGKWVTILTWFHLIDLHWFRAVTVPMHLGLIDGPFVPQNLIAAQESPHHLPKFQVTPRLRILNVFWVQKRNPDILCFSLKKSRQAKFLQVPQQGPYEERYPPTGHFYISLDISLYRKGPKKRASMFP